MFKCCCHKSCYLCSGDFASFEGSCVEITGGQTGLYQLVFHCRVLFVLVWFWFV